MPWKLGDYPPPAVRFLVEIVVTILGIAYVVWAWTYFWALGLVAAFWVVAWWVQSQKLRRITKALEAFTEAEEALETLEALAEALEEEELAASSPPDPRLDTTGHPER